MKVDRDLAGEEDNTTNSVPKVGASLTEEGEREQELFKLFNYFKEIYQITYPDQAEENHRFSIFKENLLRPTPTTTHTKFGCNCPGFADLTPDELASDPMQLGTMLYFYCSTSLSYFREMFEEYQRQQMSS